MVTDAGTDLNFGHSVAFEGSTILLGAPNDEEVASNAGAAYLFDPITGQLQSKVFAPAPVPSAQFGYSAAAAGQPVCAGLWTEVIDPGDGGPSTSSTQLWART